MCSIPAAVFVIEPWSSHEPLNVTLIKVFAEILGIHTPLLPASSLGELEDVKSGRIIALCQKLGADTYLSGEGGRAYNDPQAFAAAGIKLVYQKFIPPRYPQGEGAYLGGLSVLDLIAHTGLAVVSIYFPLIPRPTPADCSENREGAGGLAGC